MRYPGLCSLLLLISAACDDAVGSGYPGNIPSAEGNAVAADDGLVVASPDPAGGSAKERAATLGLTQEMDYACDQAGISAHVVLYGSKEVAAVLIPGKVNVPLYLDCSPTRIGLECTDGQFTAHINSLEDKAFFSAPVDASLLSCNVVQPEIPPGLE